MLVLPGQESGAAAAHESDARSGSGVVVPGQARVAVAPRELLDGGLLRLDGADRLRRPLRLLQPPSRVIDPTASSVDGAMKPRLFLVVVWVLLMEHDSILSHEQL